MRLYIVRHGIALNVGEQGITRDFDRPLSEIGREKTRAAARGLKALGYVPEVIGTSPLVRAEQTAQVLRDELDVSAEVAIVECMAPGGVPEDLMEWLNLQRSGSAMVVGHMPDVAWMTHACLANGDPQDLQFKKAAVACVVFDGEAGLGHGRLEWLYQPRFLRAQAATESD